MNDHTHELSESLRREADGVDVSALPSLAGVRSRAGRIRRRRRVVTATVAAAAVAVIAPVAWGLTADRRTDALHPADPSGSITATPPTSPTPSAAPTTGAPRQGQAMDMNLRGLPTGKNVGIGWLDMTGTAWTLHPDRGSAFQVAVPDGGVITQFASLADGRWVAITSEGSLLVWDDTGSVEHQEKTLGDGLAVDPGHRNVAWADDRGRGRVLVSDVADPITLNESQEHLTAPLAIDASKADCTRAEGEEPACSVLFNTLDDGPVYVSSTGSVTVATGDEASGNTMSSASDMWLHQNGVAGQLAGRDQNTGCGDIMLFASSPGIPNCTRIYGIFSSDGKRITVDADSPDRSDGDIGSSRLGVFDTATYTMAWNRTPGDGAGENEAAVRDRQWINDTDLAAVVYQQGAWSLVRFDRQGKATEVAPPAEGEGLRQQYALETQP